jgi:hypothetical protein
MKKGNELYLVACQADTFTQHVLEFFRIDGDGPTALNRAQAIATEARMLGKTARAAIERHKEGDGYTNSDVLEAIEWAREAGWSPGDG